MDSDNPSPVVAVDTNLMAKACFEVTGFDEPGIWHIMRFETEHCGLMFVQKINVTRAFYQVVDIKKFQMAKLRHGF